MSFRNCVAATVAAVIFTASSALAQTLTVSPDPLQQGQNASINYSDPNRAGETITIEVDNGMVINPKTDTIEITLDSSGNGSTQWRVPDWDMANFNAAGVNEQGFPIV